MMHANPDPGTDPSPVEPAQPPPPNAITTFISTHKALIGMVLAILLFIAKQVGIDVPVIPQVF